MILIGFALYTLASVTCLLSSSLTSLMLLRVIQAVGASTGTVVARAVIRDSFAAAEGAKAMSWVTIGLGAAPVVAPIIGGVVLLSGSSDGLFICMAALGATLGLLVFLKLPETLGTDAPRPAWGSLFSSYARLLGNRGFVGYTAIYGLVQGGFFAFLAVGAAVFADSFALSPTAFGLIWGFMGVAYVLGALIGGRLASGSRRPALLPICMITTLTLGLSVAAFDFLLGAQPATVLLPLFLMMIAAGCTTPMVMAGAVYQLPDVAGTAAGLSSAMGMTLGGAFTIAAGSVYRGDFTPIAHLIALSAILTFASWLIVRRA
ncbi:drug resistance transporter, Bcr/CflA subfamily [gamma proteobacterium NOR5-3]|nr:drug resistance transporter, Bcr/CflA subfamily [gamma proteobacterium NOR5-3]